jgi:hypothetical protein
MGEDRIEGAQQGEPQKQYVTVGEELGRMIVTRLDEIVRDYTEQLGTLREALGAERVRREMAESTLREGMAEQQRRREQAEQERDRLRWELEAVRAGHELPDAAEAAPVRAEPHPDVARPQTTPQGSQRSTLRNWTRRIFGR